MFSSEQTFTINGHLDKDLKKVLQFTLEFGDVAIQAFYEDKNGLVLCSYQCCGAQAYPFEPTVPVLVEHVKQYIKKLPKEDVCRMAGDKPNNDSVYLGWEVFHPLWYGDNEIEKYEPEAVIAIRPSWIVYGK